MQRTELQYKTRTRSSEGEVNNSTKASLSPQAKGPRRAFSRFTCIKSRMQLNAGVPLSRDPENDYVYTNAQKGGSINSLDWLCNLH
jgi:hypothetical protein